MRDLSLAQGFQLTEHFKQARIRCDAALVWAACVVARAQPRRRLATEHHISCVQQNLVASIPLQQFDAGSVALGQRAGAFQLTLWVAHRHFCIVELHGHSQEQMGCVRVRTIQEVACAALCRVKELGSGLMDIGILRHGRDRSAKQCQVVSRE